MPVNDQKEKNVMTQYHHLGAESPAVIDHEALAAEIHAANIVAGWWPANPADRNRPEILMLMVSELAEAAEGAEYDLPDDKLPDLPMFDVELADFAIRTYDLIGADAPEQVATHNFFRDMVGEFRLIGIPDGLMLLVRGVSAAMEDHRKGRLDQYRNNLWECLFAVYALAESRGVDLPEMIRRKRAFNAIRADHKPENRAKADGKRY